MRLEVGPDVVRELGEVVPLACLSTEANLQVGVDRGEVSPVGHHRPLEHVSNEGKLQCLPLD